MASSQGRFETFLLPPPEKKRCSHGNPKARCRECKAAGTGGTQICDHGSLKAQCKDCKAAGTGGSAFCEHGNYRTHCKDCKAAVARRVAACVACPSSPPHTDLLATRAKARGTHSCHRPEGCAASTTSFPPYSGTQQRLSTETLRPHTTRECGQGMWRWWETWRVRLAPAGFLTLERPPSGCPPKVVSTAAP